MIILGKPKNIDSYICVDSEHSKELHKLGFQPSYRDVMEGKIYYIKSEELCKVVSKIEV